MTEHRTRSGKAYDPFAEMFAQVLNAASVISAAFKDEHGAADHIAGVADEHADLTPEHLDAVGFALSTGLLMLQKLPGGREAHKRAIESARAELLKRGRTDILDELDRDGA